MNTHPGKYTPFPQVSLPDRVWPDRVITQSPDWCSVDLRDGNQALRIPMDAARKQRMFEMLVAVGFKEIEVGFPSASDTEFDFIRGLIDGGQVPDGVTLQVLAPAREWHIRRTFEALAGAGRAIVHLYNSTSTVQREVVFGLEKQGVIDVAVRGAEWFAQNAARHPETEWVFEYSPESFTGTEPDFAVAVCDAVTGVWQPTPERKVILNLPATVEMATPNVYADQIEWFSHHVARREAVVLSVHPHNDRGTAVAAAEMAVMAGAERVEGTLFGNGERTGNVDLVTLALNLHTQGVDPGLDLSDVGRIGEVYTACTGMAVNPRHPYAGELVFTAFSGSHQDAIKKGMAAQGKGRWRVPYLPIDPKDVGRGYEELVRINSQSGKGGAAFVLEREAHLIPPRDMQIAFGARIKSITDAAGGELPADEVVRAFHETYVNLSHPYGLGEYHGASGDGAGHVRLSARVTTPEGDRDVAGSGNGPIDALAEALEAVTGVPVRVMDYAEHAVGPGADASAVAYVRARVGQAPPRWGAGIDPSSTTAALFALVSAVNRVRRSEP